MIDKNSTQTEDEPNSACDERSLSDVLSGVLSDVTIQNLMPIFTLLEENGYITPKAAQTAIGKSAATTRRYLSLLCEKGILAMQGNTNAIRYVLKIMR